MNEPEKHPFADNPQHAEVWSAAELLKRAIHRLRRSGVFPREVRDLVEARLAVESEGPRAPQTEQVLLNQKGE